MKVSKKRFYFKSEFVDSINSSKYIFQLGHFKEFPFNQHIDFEIPSKGLNFPNNNMNFLNDERIFPLNILLNFKKHSFSKNCSY